MSHEGQNLTDLKKNKKKCCPVRARCNCGGKHLPQILCQEVTASHITLYSTAPLVWHSTRSTKSHLLAVAVNTGHAYPQHVQVSSKWYGGKAECVGVGVCVCGGGGRDQQLATGRPDQSLIYKCSSEGSLPWPERVSLRVKKMEAV